MQKGNGKLGYIFLIILILGLAVFLVLSFLPKYSVTGQLLKQEQAVADAEARNIQSFVEDLGKALIAVSQDEDIINPSSGTTRVLKSFIDKWDKNSLITGISVTDKDGIVIYNYSNLSPIEIGTSLADRDYFIWSKSQINSENFIVGEPVIARYGVNKGKYITVLAAPIIKNGVFSGMVASGLRIGEVTKYFLSFMRVSDSMDAYILGQNGYLFIDNQNPGIVEEEVHDSRVNDLFSNNKDLNEKIYNALSKEKKGSTIAKYVDPSIDMPVFYAISYSPVVMPGRHWLVVLAAPAEEITKASSTTYIRQVSILLFLFLMIVTVATLLRRGKI